MVPSLVQGYGPDWEKKRPFNFFEGPYPEDQLPSMRSGASLFTMQFEPLCEVQCCSVDRHSLQALYPLVHTQRTIGREELNAGVEVVCMNEEAVNTFSYMGASG